MLEKTTKRKQKVFDESKHLASKQIETYENILKSEKKSEAETVKALLGRMLELNHLERLSSQLSILYILQIFAFKVKILKISIDNINEKLTKSEILEKTKAIEETNKKIDKLIILLEAQSESMREVGENGRKHLSYVS